MTAAHLRILVLGLAFLLAGCGGTHAGRSRATAGPLGGTAVVPAPAVVQPKGELRVALGIGLPGTLDAFKDGTQLIRLGAGETLTRVTPDQQIEPWLAESVTPVDASTWRVVLRKNARFWDGSPVTPEAVIASFQRTWDTLPDASTLIGKETRISALDATTLEFKTPRPAGNLPNSLAGPQFVVQKPGTEGSILTGPYRPVHLDVDHEVTLEAFADHWAGPPPIARISVKLVQDANARLLALQAGDVDLVYGLPPELAQNLPSDLERAIVPSTRIDYLLFNTARLPFSERAVRQATSLAIDRKALNQAALDGLGAELNGVLPPLPGSGPAAMQGSDLSRARQLLDDAGWKAGPDGVRMKDGKRLAFTLYSYPGRTELTSIAVALQGQFKTLGYDVQIQQVQQITPVLMSGNFDASMFSLNALPTGDPLYVFAVSFSQSGSGNSGKYSNARLDTLMDQLRTEPDLAKRRLLADQAQAIVTAEVPNAYLLAPPRIDAYKRGKLQGYAPHPNDLYLIDRSISVQ
ncbi:MAG: ABC transporter substrate-binding protein [Dehalococcoidia bacterium]